MYWKIVWQFPKSLQVDIPYDPAIPPEVCTQENLKHMSTQNSYMNVYRSIIWMAQAENTQNVNQPLNG